MKYLIKDLSQYGVIDDLPDHELPPNAFSSAINVKFSDGSVSKAKGWASVFGLPLTSTKLQLTGYAPSVSVI